MAASRAQTLKLVTYAGYHGDRATGMRLYLGARLSKDAYNQAYARGRDMRERGMACGCAECTGGRNG
jgi:hypothetical protein